MAQLLQDLANELAYLAQRMTRRNPLLRPDVREKAALILEPSAHPHPPAESLRESESPPPSLWRAFSANCYVVFDALFVGGKDIRNKPLLERKKILKALLPDGP